MTAQSTRRALLGSVSAAVLATGVIAGFPGSASAALPIIISGGGATLPAVVVRKLFNCVSQDNAADLDVGGAFTDSQCTDTVTQAPRIYAYSPVGSGRGLQALILEDSTQLGTPSTTNNVPYATNSGPTPDSPPPLPNVNFPYSRYAFSFSDAIIKQSSSTSPTQTLDCYYGVAGAPCTDRSVTNGQALQYPVMGTGVALGFNLPANPADPQGPRRGSLNLTRDALCGIFTHTITTWNDPALTANNANLPAAPITVVRRLDSSGTNFLFTQHLSAVCPGWIGTTGGGATSATWDPSFFKADGNTSVSQAVAAGDNPVAGEPVRYTIAYMTPELAKPVVDKIDIVANTVDDDLPATASWHIQAETGADAPQSANIQNASGNFRALNLGNISTALASNTPPGSSDADHNGIIDEEEPAKWGLAMLAPDPTDPNAYPIVGFEVMATYTCYQLPGIGDGMRAFMQWYLNGATGAVARQVVRNNGFTYMPGNWVNAVRRLTTQNPETRISSVSGTIRNAECIGKVGGGIKQ